MEDKFDTEFKRKVKSINPEIPDVVRMRINDTLSSLPERKSWRRYGYLSAVAALFLVCIVGIKYIFPMNLNKKEAAMDSPAPKMAAMDSSLNQNEASGANLFAMDENTKDGTNADKEKTDKVVGDLPNASLKIVPSSGTIKSTTPNYEGKSNLDVKFTSKAGDGSTADDKGIQLILKTAIYDGKEIRVEFDKSNSNLKSSKPKAAKENNIAASSEKSMALVGDNIAKQYEVRVSINGIPLKCSINVIETSMGENQYSGTMIIVPDSSLPENFSMVLNLDKIGEVSGQWLLTTHVEKQ